MKYLKVAVAFYKLICLASIRSMMEMRGKKLDKVLSNWCCAK